MTPPSDRGPGASRATSILLGERHSSAFNRIIAKGIDTLVLLAVFYLGRAIWGPLGLIAAALFAAFGDAAGSGQSIGKKIMALRVIEDSTGVSCTVQHSFIRNVPLVLSVVFATMPPLWAFLVILCAPVVGFEIYLLLTLESGVRLGDVLGDTLVVEAVDGMPTAHLE